MRDQFSQRLLLKSVIASSLIIFRDDQPQNRVRKLRLPILLEQQREKALDHLGLLAASCLAETGEELGHELELYGVLSALVLAELGEGLLTTGLLVVGLVVLLILKMHGSETVRHRLPMKAQGDIEMHF